MDEEILYPVCPHRNVATAFQRFLGPDAGGVDRFFDSPLERERFFGRNWPYRFAALASMREATQELLALPARQRSAVAELVAALRPIATDWRGRALGAVAPAARRAAAFFLAAGSPAPGRYALRSFTLL
jgi:hypothetical protein